MRNFIRTNAWLPLVFVLLGLVLYSFVDPAPPGEITMATGQAGGRYARVGEYLRDELAKEGITLHLVSTAGSAENMAQLVDPDGAVSIALVQSGLEDVFDAGDTELYGLGSLFYEPLWLFYRTEHELDLVTSLRGLRIAIGEPGSGTRAVVRYLMADNGLLEAEAGLTVLDIGGAEAVQALGSGQIDAAFFTMSPLSDTITALVETPGIDFLGIRRSAAYTARYPFLSSVTISEGLLDLERDIPPEDRPMLASAATLVVNERFHPAFTPLVLEAMTRMLQRGHMLERPGEFPSPAHSGFTLTREAAHYHASGPPLLFRMMPFWAASLFDRLVIFVVPLLVLMIPLVKLAGPVYRWRMRARIYRWYGVLLDTDRRLAEGQVEDIARERRKIEELVTELASVDVPLSFSDELYHLKQHAEYVIRRLG